MISIGLKRSPTDYAFLSPVVTRLTELLPAGLVLADESTCPNSNVLLRELMWNAVDEGYRREQRKSGWSQNRYV